MQFLALALTAAALLAPSLCAAAASTGALSTSASAPASTTPSDRSDSPHAALAHLPGPGSADNGACAFLLDACAADALAVPPALLHKSACVAALPCVAGVQTVDDVLALWLGALAPPAAAEPRLSPNVRPSCACAGGRG
jgi:hypothetical protein